MLTRIFLSVFKFACYDCTCFWQKKYILNPILIPIIKINTNFLLRLADIFLKFDAVSLGKALHTHVLHFTQVKINPVIREMSTISFYVPGLYGPRGVGMAHQWAGPVTSPSNNTSPWMGKGVFSTTDTLSYPRERKDVSCWASVVDGGPIWNQRRANVSCSLGGVGLVYVKYQGDCTCAIYR